MYIVRSVNVRKWIWCVLSHTVIIVVNECECECCVCLHELIRFGCRVFYKTAQAWLIHHQIITLFYENDYGTKVDDGSFQYLTLVAPSGQKDTQPANRASTEMKLQRVEW